MVKYDLSIEGIISNCEKWEKYYMNMFSKFINFIKSKKK